MKLRSSRFADLGTPRAAGLTLVEILVTLAIVALLMTLAVPSFKPMLDRWRVKQSLGAMTDTIRFARSEGIKRGGNVVIQKLPNNTDGCVQAPTATDWGCGWRVFVDSNADGSYSANEEVLMQVQVPSGMAVTHVLGVAGTNAETIAVNRWGNMDGLNTKRFQVFPSADGLASRATRTLCLAAGGRLHENEGTAC